MIVIPAVDIKNGKCVRLLQGRKDAETVYSDDPPGVARRWADEGAELLHVVDLDGAFEGFQRNIEVIRQIRNTVDIEIEVGGGIRDMDSIERLISIGVNRVILGTVAVERPGFVKEACERYPYRIIAGIDARDGFVAVKGWVEMTGIRAVDLALKMQDCGVWGIIYTDISRDGMMTGPNIEAMSQMVRSLNVPVIASGGVSSIEDIKRLAGVNGLWGVITGKALYTGTLDLKEAIEIVKRKT